MSVSIRPGTLTDAEAICSVYLASRKQFLPYVPLVHSDEAVLHYITTQLIPNYELRVAVTNEEIVGMMALG